MADVVGVGLAMCDILIETDSFPREDTKTIVRGAHFQCGGPAPTALTAISRLGLTTEAFGAVGDDTNGDFIVRELAALGVESGKIRQIPGTSSPLALVVLNKGRSTRTSFVSMGSAIAYSDESCVDLQALRQAKALHLDGNLFKTALFAAQSAKAAGVLVSYDAGRLFPGAEQLLALSDVLVPSEQFARAFTGESSAEKAAAKLQAAFRPSVLAVTQGERGGFLWTEGAARRYPVFPVKALDTNGAGDVFHGAFLAALLQGKEPYDAACFASAAAAIKCTRVGSQRAVPSYEEVSALLSAGGGQIVACDLE